MVMDKDLERKIKERQQEALDKQIFAKLKKIMKEFGNHTRPSYQDSGEIFYEDLWVYQKKGLNISLHQGHFGHYTLIIKYQDKIVYKCEQYCDKPEEINAYAPGKVWEKIINSLFSPFKKEEDQEKQEAEKNLKARFGL